MSAPISVDLRALERDIVALFVKHGLGFHDTVQVAAYKIEQAGQTAGITVDAWAYTCPEGLPTERPEEPSPLSELADQLAAEATS